MGESKAQIIRRIRQVLSLIFVGFLAACTTGQSFNHATSCQQDGLEIDVHLKRVRYQRFGSPNSTGTFVYGVMLVRNPVTDARSFDRDDYHLYVSGYLSAKPEPEWSPAAVATCTVTIGPGEVLRYEVYWFFDAYVGIDELKRSTVQYIRPETDRPPCRF